MVLTVIISILTICTLIFSIIKFPTIKIGKRSISTFWVVAVIGALLLILTLQIGVNEIIDLSKSEIVNPIEILILFISVTIISIVLDEAGFFNYLATKTAKICRTSQKKLFIYLYLLVSILTIFTSNDIIILTFTPFICMLAKRTKINPIPYLIAEFVAANSWSMMLMIGNPTNIFLSLTFDISFFEYFKVMVIPTIVGGVTSFLLLLLIFRKTLKEPIEYVESEDVKINKPLTISGLIHLGLCIILLAISNFINLDMWLICLIFATSLLIITLFIKKDICLKSVKRAPWNLVPFILSMFIIVLTLNKHGVLEEISNVLLKLGNGTQFSNVMVYGFFSIISDNLINNIPMSLAAIKILNGNDLASVYAVIIGSNLGACLTPIGALAGIMWMSILKKEKVDLSFVDFVDYGFLIIPLTALITFLSLILVI